MEHNINIKISVVLPCLNEEKAVGICIDKIQEVFAKESIAGEIIVVDNGSTDKTVQIASDAGAKVVYQPVKGYGSAYLKGFDESCGEIIIMGDADNSYDFHQISSLIKEINKGYDLVIGSRFKGQICKGAMSFSHRYIGNPVLTTLLNIFFKSRISDAHSGFRAITRKSLDRLNLKSLGMEFASEMIVTALREKLKIQEVPITYYPRKGGSKLNSFPDAWRHIRFMLLFSPDWLFMVPGLILFFMGFLALVLAGLESFVLFGHRFDVHAMILFTFVSLVGFQIINLGLFAKTYSYLEGFIKEDKLLEKFYNMFVLEKGILLGVLSLISGLFINGIIFFQWIKTGFGPLNEVKISLVGLLLMVVGIQTIFSSFFLSLLGLPRKK